MNTTPLTPPPEYGLCTSYDESQEKMFVHFSSEVGLYAYRILYSDALVDNVSVGE